MSRWVPAAAMAAVLCVLLAACGSSSKSESATSAKSASCAKADLQLTNAGVLTVATDKPAYPPYFVNDTPANGKGFESAVAYGIARQLGFAPGQVKWVVEPFNASYAPGPKNFDFDLNQISINPARARQVDFSIPYYRADQAVVTAPGSTLAPRTLADLKGAKIGVQIGTTSLDAVNQTIQPSQQPQVFNDSNDVVTALKQKRVDAIVTDLPTAFYITAAQVSGAKIVGQFDAPGGDAWGALLARNSPLTNCVSNAVSKMKISGELDRITQKWMGAAAGAPKLG
jgi:polar amino acid transport system substrate-binding protein